jgi:amidohydrolase
MSLDDEIKRFVELFYAEMVIFRRQFHEHPELSGEEKETSEYICKQLDKLGIPYRKNVAGYGVVALLQGNRVGEGSCIALRADMDALPVQERNECEYRSKNNGVMHACGHDFHCAALLGALMILKQLQDHFSGTVKAIFQPSEERCEGGAPFMIAEGVLENPKVDKIFGLHAEAALEVGNVGFCTGNYMASSDELFMTVHGKGGHAALLREICNPVYIAANIILELQKAVKLCFQDVDPEAIEALYILNFGKFIANGATNVIPDTVEIEGTLRTFNEMKRKEIHKVLTTVSQDIAKKMGGTCQLHINHGYPVLKNDVAATQFAQNIAEQLFGKEHVKQLPPKTTSEDFSFFLQKIPGTFFRVGIANPEKGITHQTHHNRFDIDESALKTAAALLSGIVVYG